MSDDPEEEEIDTTPRPQKRDDEDEDELVDEGGGPPQLRLLGFDEVMVEPDRDAWVTPKWIADAIGSWDLDPATNERSYIQAARTFMLDRGQDGLALARYVGRQTRVWCNPPFSRGQVIKFVRAYRHTNFCFLLRLDFSTEWFSELWPSIGLILVPMNQRVAFDAPPGAVASSTPFPHGLIYKRPEDATPDIIKLCYPLAPARSLLEGRS